MEKELISDKYEKYEGGYSINDDKGGGDDLDGLDNSQNQSYAEDDLDLVGLESFKHNTLGGAKMFEDLAKKASIGTGELDVINMILTMDSTLAMALMEDKEGEDEQDVFKLHAYSLVTQDEEPVFVKKFMGTYLRMNIIEQNDKGDMFAIPY